MTTRLTNDQRVFNDLAAVVIYHYADVCYKNRAARSARRLAKLGVIENLDDIDNAYERYETQVVEYAREHLPDDYTLRYDYWGCKCFSNQTGWSAPKTGLLFAGDGPGQVMLFDCFEAMEQYTNRIVADLSAANDDSDDD